MRIVDVNPYFYPWPGGIEDRMHRIAKELVRRGHEVIIVTGRLPDTEEDEVTEFGYRVIRLPSKHYDIYQPPYVSSKGLLEKLNELRPDVVNYNYRWAPSYNRDMLRYEGRKTYTCHNTYGEGAGWQKLPSKANDWLFFRHIEEYDCVIFVSEYFCDDFRSRGIGLSKTAVAQPCLESYPDVSGTEKDYIISMARFVAVKGLRYLIEAMVYVDCRLIICGKGPEGKRLRKLVADLGLSDKVEIRGYTVGEEKERLQRECKFTVIPSLHEAFCLAAAEFMSYGKPVVCTDVDGLPYTVKDGGVLVPPKDPKALAEAINDLLRDDAKRKAMGRRAREISEGYSVGRVTDVIEKVFREVVGE